MCCNRIASVRDIWDTLIETCQKSYHFVDNALSECTYILNKPAKYSIKIVMLCGAKSKYMIDANPYLEKGTKTEGFALSNYYIKYLTKSIYEIH